MLTCPPGLPSTPLPPRICTASTFCSLRFFVPSCDFSVLPLEGLLGSGDKPEDLTEGLQENRPHVAEMQDSVGAVLGSSWVWGGSFVIMISENATPQPP